MVDVTDAAVEALAEELRSIGMSPTNVGPWSRCERNHQQMWRQVARHFLTSRQPKPEDLEQLVSTVRSNLPGRVGHFLPDELYKVARAILALYAAPPHAPTRAALDSALDPILGHGVARRAVVDAVLGLLDQAADEPASIFGTTEAEFKAAWDEDLRDRLNFADARIVYLEAELAAGKSGAIRLGEGLTEAQEAMTGEEKADNEQAAWNAASALDGIQWSKTKERSDFWIGVQARLRNMATALRASAAPKAEAVDWWRQLDLWRENGTSDYTFETIVDGLLKKVTTLRSAAGGSV